MTDTRRILCLSRAYPPVIGGIERQNHELFTRLATMAEVKIFANRYGKKNIPFFLPLVLIKSLVYLPKYDAILLGDGMLSIVGWFIKLISDKKVVCIVHGLDVTYPNFIYQRLWVRHFMPRIDMFVAVSAETRMECIRHGLSAEKIEVVPNGVNLGKYYCDDDKCSLKSSLTAILGKSNDDKKIILTVGRLVRRKGVAWFVASVMTRLPQEVSYLVVGEGEDRSVIERAINENELNDRVFLLGQVDEEQKNKLYAIADLYIQPNIHVAGDVEGFGLVVLEAAASCTWVIAARIDGLLESVVDGRNGVLVDAKNEEQFTREINKYLMDDALRHDLGKQARDFVGEWFEWGRIAQRYFDILTRTNG